MEVMKLNQALIWKIEWIYRYMKLQISKMNHQEKNEIVLAIKKKNTCISLSYYEERLIQYFAIASPRDWGRF